MAKLLLQRIRPINRKQRLLDYLNIQTSGSLETKAKEKQIDKEIEAVFEELVAEPGDVTYISEMDPEELDTEKLYEDPELRREQSKIQNSNRRRRSTKKQIFFESETREFEKYSEKFESVVETANILHQQLQELTNDGIILSEDTDVSYDDVQVIVEREHSPIPHQNKKKRRVTQKPVKQILHITGDSTLEYFEDCQTIDDVEALEYKENSPVREKKKKQRGSKKAANVYAHITGDSSPEDFDSQESTPKSSPTRSVSFPCVSRSNPENMVIGPNETIVNKHDYKNIDWALSAPIVTRKLLLYIFGRDILSTHSLTGKPSPAFLDQKKPLKKPLDAKKVADIIYIVTKKKDVKPKEVRLTITSKCADEQKMRKTRMLK